MGRGVLFLTVAAVGVAALALPATPAAAASTTLAAPTGVRLAAVTGSSLTAAAHRAANATGYRVFASTRRSDLYVANIGRARASKFAHTPRVTVTGLRYTTALYYYRVQSLRGSKHRLEAMIHTAALRPAAPGAFRLTSTGPTYLTWTAGPVTGYVVEQATNPAFTAGRRTYSLRAGTNQLTAYGVQRGTRYWFRMRALNHATRSAYSPARSVRATKAQVGLTVMTYNVLEGIAAGQRESGTVIATWLQRRPGVVALIQRKHPDVLAIQEAASWVGSLQGYGGTRQVDDLARALGSGYTLAATETPPWVHGYRRTANYLLFRTATWSATPVGGHWDIGDRKFAAYQVLQHRASGARVLVISTHLATGTGASNDAIRQRETTSLVRQAAALGAPSHLPIVYAGDFNSDVNRNHAFDGPGRAMLAAHVSDAENAARILVNSRYNSANLYLRTPPAVDQSIDHIYTGPGVAVRVREVVLGLVNGRFPGIIPSDHNPLYTQLYVSY
jgi:endonuclease/exonuclease/phosphatase family metal-dependent hydrolase